MLPLHKFRESRGTGTVSFVCKEASSVGVRLKVGLQACGSKWLHHETRGSHKDIGESSYFFFGLEKCFRCPRMIV